MIKLLAFDLDGTLTCHKTPLCEENRKALEALGKKYKLLMVGAGNCRRIFEQMGRFPIDIIGNYGMQYAEYNAATGDLETKEDNVMPCDRESCEKREAFNFLPGATHQNCTQRFNLRANAPFTPILCNILLKGCFLWEPSLTEQRVNVHFQGVHHVMYSPMSCIVIARSPSGKPQSDPVPSPHIQVSFQGTAPCSARSGQQIGSLVLGRSGWIPHPE